MLTAKYFRLLRAVAPPGGSLLRELRLDQAPAQCANCNVLTTTNDNLNALRFYQKRGLVLVTVHRNALTRSRQLKPQIPLIGNDGIPLRDEIELEMILEVES